MIEKIFARQMENGLWQWRLREKHGWQNQSYYTGDAEALLTSLEGQRDLPVCLLLRGASCVARMEMAETKNRRTLAKLLPYELEEDIIDPIDELHFAFGEVMESKVPLVYTRLDNVANAIQKIEAVGCDVAQVLPDYLLLERGADEMIVVWDEDQVLAHYGRDQGFAIQTNIGQLYLKQLKLDVDRINRVILVAETSGQCDELMSWLPSDLYEGPEIVVREGGFWDCIDCDLRESPLDLRSGPFSRQLPLVKWWQSWQTPIYYAAAAVGMAIVVNLALLFEARGEYNAILETRKDIFLQAIPNGRWQTPERELKARLGDNTASDSGTNFMYLLEGVARAVDQKDNVTMGSLRYNGDQHELIISFEVNNFADVESVRAEIEKLGYKAETLRAAAEGETFQARMKISRAVEATS